MMAIRVLRRARGFRKQQGFVRNTVCLASSSRSITEVKQRLAQLVLGWVTRTLLHLDLQTLNIFYYHQDLHSKISYSFGGKLNGYNDRVLDD